MLAIWNNGTGHKVDFFAKVHIIIHQVQQLKYSVGILIRQSYIKAMGWQGQASQWSHAGPIENLLNERKKNISKWELLSHLAGERWSTAWYSDCPLRQDVTNDLHFVVCWQFVSVPQCQNIPLNGIYLHFKLFLLWWWVKSWRIPNLHKCSSLVMAGFSARKATFQIMLKILLPNCSAQPCISYTLGPTLIWQA